jgi:ADP-ribose pyrophosphatase
MDKIKIEKSCVKAVFDSRFIHVFDLQYAPGKHYFDATRRPAEKLAAVKTDEEFRNMVPDAVSCFVILEKEGEEPALLLTREFRYPAGQFLLSVPAGLIDPEDAEGESPAVSAAMREIHEETGLAITDKDRITLVNPLVFSSPGFTDESNALVCAVIHPDADCFLTQAGARGSERFDGFVPLKEEEARRILKNGRDDRGIFYPVYTWMALLYFVSGMWKEQA